MTMFVVANLGDALVPDPVADGDVLANISGATAVPVATTVTALLDHVFGSAQGMLLYRGVTSWTTLVAGTNGQVLQTQSAIPQWATVNGINAVADGDVLANTSGSSALPVATTLTGLLDHVFGSTQGMTLFRGPSGWTTAPLLPPSTTVTGAGTISTGGNVWVNNMSGGAITLTLASALTPFVLFKDVAGNANTHPITISFSGGIDGGTSTSLSLSYQWATLGWNGSSYSIIG